MRTQTWDEWIELAVAGYSEVLAGSSLQDLDEYEASEAYLGGADPLAFGRMAGVNRLRRLAQGQTLTHGGDDVGTQVRKALEEMERDREMPWSDLIVAYLNVVAQILVWPMLGKDLAMPFAVVLWLLHLILVMRLLLSRNKSAIIQSVLIFVLGLGLSGLIALQYLRAS